MGRQEAIIEKAKRILLERNRDKHESLFKYISTIYAKELKKEYDNGWIYHKICNTLERVYNGEIKRLIINMPPRLGKSDLVTKGFSTWVLGKRPQTKFIVTGYSALLMERFSGEARIWYESDSYRIIFPRRPKLRDDQNTKQWWTNDEGGSYYAVGAGGAITGVGSDIIIVDDPQNPKDLQSDVIRTGVNNWYHNVLESRLDDKRNGAIIIIMQRVHGDDLCGHLMELESQNLGEKWEKLIFPAIAEETDEYRKEGESINENRLPLNFLRDAQAKDKILFSCQYQQRPYSKDSQEFHEEWFKYYDEYPKNGGRIFTAVDPAFTKKTSADDTAIMTGMFVKDSLYILEYTAGKFDPGELIDKIVYHIAKWRPEKIGVEAFQAQVTISFSLKAELNKRQLYTQVEDIRQTGDKESKIRRLIPLYRNGLIYHKRDMDRLEKQLLEFPRGKHDDICFVAGTKIATTKGDKNIEDVRAGDYIITPFGYSKVKTWGYTGILDVITKFGLTGTRKHKVFSYGKGFIELEKLIRMDTLQMLSANNLIKWKILSLLYSSDLNIGGCEREDITYLSQQLIKKESEQNDYTLPCMKIIIKLLFQKDFVFIIKTVIHLIMTLITWNVYLFHNTLLNIVKRIGQIMNLEKKSSNILKKSEIGQKNGIEVKNEGNGIVTMLKFLFQKHAQKNGEKQINLKENVMNVESYTKQLVNNQNTVRSSVTTKCNEERLEKIGGKKTQRKGYAENAEMNLKHITSQNGVALQDVRSIIVPDNGGIKPVYNLSTEAGVYYANGILVSNCDSLQMLYNLYELQPNTIKRFEMPRIEYDSNGYPVFNNSGNYNSYNI